ncbi:hypothetical protein GCM10009827_040600 [Dactylosporangium maewongense]|uniref:Uncharacterized protein n=1 Tax=Dactylosporangium maewongense TaxID=634393 RepID=A0ABN2AJL5_9ACTN
MNPPGNGKGAVQHEQHEQSPARAESDTSAVRHGGTSGTGGVQHGPEWSESGTGGTGGPTGEAMAPGKVSVAPAHGRPGRGSRSGLAAVPDHGSHGPSRVASALPGISVRSEARSQIQGELPTRGETVGAFGRMANEPCVR